MNVIPYLLVYAGSALMAFNIYLYLRFARTARKVGNWAKESRVLYFPIVLLILFLAGYLAVGVFGKPDFVIGGILAGGSVFVTVMLWLIKRTVERIKENEALSVKLAAAEEASKAKTFFLSNMSHDLRTPLNAIIGYTAIAKSEKTSPAEKDKYFTKIETAGNQLLDIVNSVLEMSRIENGKFEQAPVRTDLEACAREIAEIVEPQFAAKKIGFSFSFEAEHKWTMCDKTLLSRMLINLLNNAAKFTGEGGRVSFNVKELGQNGKNADYSIIVKDNGIGMDPAFVNRLFTPFEREKTSTVSKIQGTGLGLAISKSIVDLMGGRILVQSEKGKGTEFTVLLSLPLTEPEPVPEKPERAEIRFNGRRVLLAEDNPINLEIAEMILADAGFAVETAEDGQIAVDKAAAAPDGYYDLILMDIQMPVMDGYAATRAIRALRGTAVSRIPIVAMTANAFDEDIRNAKDAGMNGHIAKPLDVNVMMKTIQSVLK